MSLVRLIHPANCTQVQANTWPQMHQTDIQMRVSQLQQFGKVQKEDEQISNLKCGGTTRGVVTYAELVLYVVMISTTRDPQTNRHPMWVFNEPVR